MREHGTTSMHRTGCRCEPCRAAQAAANKEWRRTAPARLAEDPRLAQHGTVSTYQGWGCRCPQCSEAAAANDKARGATEARRRKRRAKAVRLLLDPTLAPHGVVSTYEEWSCRCDECCAAQKAKGAARYAARKQNAKQEVPADV